MPRGKNGNGKGGVRQGQPEWGGFIDVRLSNGDQVEFAAWENEHEFDDVDDVLGEGCKLAVSFDKSSDTYLATLTSENHVSDGFRYVLTARAGLWEKAIRLVIYKHMVLLEGDWGRYKPSNGRAAEV